MLTEIDYHELEASPFLRASKQTIRETFHNSLSDAFGVVCVDIVLFEGQMFTPTDGDYD